MGGFEFGDLLGPAGGQLALAFGAGCTAGYAFCIRTVYKLLGEGHNSLYEKTIQHCEKVEQENKELKTRICLLEERIFHGQANQLEQIRQSSLRVLGADKLIRGNNDG